MPRPPSRLFVLGQSPLPTEPSRLMGSGNLRTWHFVKPLLDAGHTVRLVTARMPGSLDDDETGPIERHDGALHHIAAPMERFNDLEFLQEQLDSFDADGLIGINLYPSSRLVQLESELPMWCDLNGWAMAEAQTKAVTYDDDCYLSHFWNLERAVLRRADVVSTVSQAQAQATVGELAMLGRLGRETVGYDFCHTIPNALVERHPPTRPGILRGRKVPEDAFVVLWAGGYNTWTDVDLLHNALVRAMEASPQVHFVSTGGALKGHDDLTFQRFRDRMDASSVHQRVHFVGWVPSHHVASYYAESDLGINVDRACYETQFGARNRLNDMLKAGLPILTTLGTEISHQLAARDLALTAPMGDVDQFAEHILWASRHHDAVHALGQQAAAFAKQELSYSKTTQPLRTWAEDPARAPDLGQAVELADGVDFFTMPLPEDQPLPEPEPAEPPVDWQGRCSELEQQLADITHSKMYRLWMAYLKVRSIFVRGGRAGQTANTTTCPVSATAAPAGATET